MPTIKSSELRKKRKKQKAADKAEEARGITSKLVDIADLPRISKEFEATDPDIIASRKLDEKLAKEKIEGKLEEKRRIETEIKEAPRPPSVIETLTTPDPNFERGVDDRSGAEKVLDVISAPISQPGTFFTKGPGAGGEAVARQREDISSGGESGTQTILTILGNTGIAIGALLTGAGGAAAATAGLTGATGATIATGLTSLYAVDRYLLSPGEIGTWAAVDNVGSALGFQSKIVADGVVFDGADPGEANALLDDMQSNVANMVIYVDGETSRNPKLWASRKPLLEALNVASETIELQRTRVNGQG